MRRLPLGCLLVVLGCATEEAPRERPRPVESGPAPAPRAEPEQAGEVRIKGSKRAQTGPAKPRPNEEAIAALERSARDSQGKDHGAAATAPPKAEPAKEAVWGESFAAAQQAARSTGKVILADFTGSDWCGWCKKLKKEVFETPEFKAWAAENVVLLELDYPRGKPLSPELKAQNDELAARFGVHGYPTLLFLDADGKQVGPAMSGYYTDGLPAYMSEFRKVLESRR